MKETKELVVGLMALSSLMAKHFKDGVQLGKDFPAIWAEISSDEALKLKLEAAYKDAGLIKGEWQEVSVAKVAELVAAMLPEVVALIESIKAQQEVVPGSVGSDPVAKPDPVA